MIPGILASAIRRAIGPGPTPPDLVTEYLTATEMTHDWANLTGWTTSGVQVDSNRLYGISGGNPCATAIPFPVAAGECAKLTADIHLVSGNGSQYVGFSFGGGNDGVNASLPNFVGVGLSGTAAFYFVGSLFSGVSVGALSLGGSGSPASSAASRATVVVDEQNISLVLQSQDGSTMERYTLMPRSAAPNGGAITSIVAWNSDTRGTSGNYIKAIGAKKSLTPFRTKSNAAGTIEGDTDLVIHRKTGSDTWRIQLPAVMDGETPCKVVEFFHQHGGSRTAPAADSRWTRLRKGIAANRYALLSADDGNRWGNPASLANYAAMVNWVGSKVYCGDLCLLGYSMGGLAALNSISNDALAPVAFAGICPVADLIAMRSNASFTASIDAAWGSSSDASLIAASAGYDPVSRAPADFGGVAYQFIVGSSDATVPRADHTDVLEPAIAPYATHTEIDVLGTSHGTDPQFDPSYIVGHFNDFTGYIPEPSADPYWAQVHSLLHFNDGDGATTFADEKGVVWTRQSTAVQASATQARFGSSSLFIPDTTATDYIRAAGLDLTGLDYCVDAWIYPTRTTDRNGIWTLGDVNANNGRTQLAIESGLLVCYSLGNSGSSSYSLSSTRVIRANRWTHTRIARAGSLMYMFIDGTLEGTWTAMDINAAYLNVGASRTANTVQSFQGYLDEFRLTIGASRNTVSQAFAVPGSAFPNS